MYIVFGEEEISKLSEKYLVLELDTFKVNDKNIPTYCILDSGSIGIGSLHSIGNSVELHNNLIENYKRGDWNLCHDALEHLRGSFNGELDSFYGIISSRISGLSPDETHDWDDGVIAMS